MSLPTLSGRPRWVTGAQVTISIGDRIIKPFTLPYSSGGLAEVSWSEPVVMTKRQCKQMRRFMCALLAKTSRRSRKAKRWTQ